MASGGGFAVEFGETCLPMTPESKRKRGAAVAAERGSRHSGPSKERSDEKRGIGNTGSRFEWPFPRREGEREGDSRPRKSQRHSVDWFFESSEFGLGLFGSWMGRDGLILVGLESTRELPPPYQHQSSPVHGLSGCRPQRRWRRRSFPKRSVRRPSERRDRAAKPVPERGRTVPSPASSQLRDGIEWEWCMIREAQEQLRKDRQALERDKAAHEEEVRYELEQLGRDIEEERNRLRQRRDHGRYGFLPYSPPSEDARADEAEEETYYASWFGGYEYPPDDSYWRTNGGSDIPDYDGDEDSDDGSFVAWESEDEPEAFRQSAYRPYFQPPPHYDYFDESHQVWTNDASSHSEQPRCWKQKSEEMKKAYDAYIAKWKTISATASSVPYPTTNLTSALLLDEPEIEVSVPLTEDQTMELNSALFFLLAFDLQPNTILNSAGTPKMEIDPQADLEKVEALRKQMKLERNRWHPDSLVKRRVGGVMDQVTSKRVYRAVDELLEECKRRLDGA